jgi:hypothetical protein
MARYAARASSTSSASSTLRSAARSAVGPGDLRALAGGGQRRAQQHDAEVGVAARGREAARTAPRCARRRGARRDRAGRGRSGAGDEQVRVHAVSGATRLTLPGLRASTSSAQAHEGGRPERAAWRVVTTASPLSARRRRAQLAVEQVVDQRLRDVDGVDALQALPGGDAVDLEHLDAVARGQQVDAGVVHVQRARGASARRASSGPGPASSGWCSTRAPCATLCTQCSLMRRIAARAVPPMTSTRQSWPGRVAGGTKRCR